MNESFLRDLVDLDSCEDGLIIHVWQPTQNLTTGEVIGRGITYVVSMCYLFVGIAYLADIFMSAIEMITSTKKEIRIKNDKGIEEVVVIRVWNQTVANLSLIALGGAAPEVFLSIIELIKHNFEFEELGPSEMVASASFNVMVIVSVCVFVIPKGESRRIVNFEVFLVVVAWSMFAYLWLILVTAVISPGIIEVWEAAVTLGFFPLSLACAYLTDIYIAKKKKKKETTSSYQLGFKNKVLVETTTNNDQAKSHDDSVYLKRFSIEEKDEALKKFEEQRREFIALLKQLRLEHPLIDSKELELMAAKEMLDRGSKSRAFDRMTVSKKLTGFSSWRIRKDIRTRQDQSPTAAHQNALDRNVTEVFFSPGHYTVKEDIGAFTVTVCRRNGDMNQQVLVDYVSEDADALAGREYNPIRGTLCFQPGQKKKFIEVTIIDDMVYEGDHHFYIRLFNLRYGGVSKTSRKLSDRGQINADAYAVSIGSSRMRSSSVIVPPPTSSNDLLQVMFDNNKRSSLHSLPILEKLQPAGLISRNSINTLREFELNEIAASPYLRLACPSLATILILDNDHSGFFTIIDKNVSVKVDGIGKCPVTILRYGGTRGTVVVPYRTEEGTAVPGRDYTHCEGELVFENGENEYEIRH